MNFWRQQILAIWLASDDNCVLRALPEARMEIIRRVLFDAVRAGEIEQDAADASIALIMADNFDAARTVLGLDDR